MNISDVFAMWFTEYTSQIAMSNIGVNSAGMKVHGRTITLCLRSLKKGLRIRIMDETRVSGIGSICPALGRDRGRQAGV
jgi:hypothetical protein